MGRCAWRCGGAAAVLMLGLGAPAAAETQVMLGAGVAALPDYPGSNDYDADPLPFLRLKWAGEAAEAPDSGVKGTIGLIDATAGIPQGVEFGVARLSTPERHLTLRVGGGWRLGRDQDDNRALRGMGDLDGQPTLHLKLESEPVSKHGIGSFFGVGWETDVSGETRGDALTLYGGNTFALSGRTTLKLTAHASWFDDDYMRAYFGVSPAQAAQSGHPAFAAGSGVGETGLEARLHWAFADAWSLYGSVGVSRLLGDAADSPLVDDAGSATQFNAGTGVAYRF